MTGAYLGEAYLGEAYLGGANLTRANLTRANLTGADLGGAYLTGAYLVGANLTRANLDGANLTRADLVGAYLGDVKIKLLRVFSGLYRYTVFAIVAEDGTEWINLGCKLQKAEEWNANFWNNISEFPDDGSIKTRERQFALATAKAWLEMHREVKG